MSVKRGLWMGLGILITVVTLGLGARQILAQSAAAPASQQAGDVIVCTWLGCKTAAVSYSQDDAGNLNGSNSCRPQLEAAGFRGTFYYDGNTTQPWMAAASAAGHEVASHLVSHNLNCTMPPSCFPNCTPAALWQTPYTASDVTNFRLNQIEPNISAIEAGTGKPVISMAYPCGNTDAARMTAAQSYFIGARGYYDPWDSNFPWTYDVNQSTPVEFMNLNADTYFSQALVDKAISQGSWEIPTIHDYCEGISYLSSKRDSLWVAPVGEVLKYIRVRNATVLSNYSRIGQAISFDAVHTLNTLQRQKVDGTQFTPIVYDNPVTLRVRLLDADTVLSVQANGTPLAFTVQTIAGSRYVLIDTPLNFSRHIDVALGSGPATATATPLATATPTAGPSATPTNTPTPGPTATPTSTSLPVVCPCSLWNDTVVPATPAVSDVDPLELGVQFRTNTNGYITGLRFYKGSTNTGTHIGRLWSSDGTQLAIATFVNETASGWQTVYFANPVAVTANITYVASYQAPNGHFAVDRSYFNTEYANGPLYAYGTGQVAAGNGVYAYLSGFPTQSYLASNYWVDVIFDTTAPAVTATPTPTATPIGTPEPPTATPTVIQSPTPTPLPPTATSTPAPVVCPCSLWNDTIVPAVPTVGDVDPVELGVQFRANVDGYITGLRFYKGSTNTGPHVGNLWTSTGTLLATATFVNESASGWQTVSFANPVTVTANTAYVASYQTTVGHFSVDRFYFNASYSNGPLYAFSTGELTAGNGVFRYPSGFPNASYQASNYWVDVIFDTSVVASTPTATAVPPTATPTNTPLPPTATSTAAPSNTGFLGPTGNAAVSGGDANGFEVSPTNAYLSDSVYAVDNNSGTSTSTSCTNTGKDRHDFTTYNLNVPTSATVLGLEVQLQARVDNTAGTPRMCVQLSFNGGTTWTVARTTTTLSTTRRTDTLGSATDLWGRVWLPSELSNGNFRVRIINVSSSTARDFSLDSLAVRVTYR